MASLGDVDAWHALRSRHLDAELSVLRRRRPEERRSCLRALRLELHPDKQPIERRSAASELFTRVQLEWEKLHAADHLRSLREDIQQGVMRGGLGRTRNATSVLMWRINTAKSNVAHPYDVEGFLQTHRIEAHVATIVRRLPSGVQQKLMNESLTGARDTTAALMSRVQRWRDAKSFF